jgi:hypothetical protein
MVILHGLIKMFKIDLHNYVQDKTTVAEYEVGFNQIVRFSIR